MKSKLIFIALSLFFTTSCGAIQKARYYAPGTLTPINKAWGDGLATADNDVCIWVGDETAMYLPLMAGPIGVPFFPLGILSSTPDRLGYFDLAVWIVPEQNQLEKFRFDPKKTTITFSNGVTADPRTIQVSKFKTEWTREGVSLFKPELVERISYPEHLGPKSITEFNQPIELWDWSRFIMRFEKPDKNGAPTKVEIKGLSYIDGASRTYTFNFHEVEKHRYLISGQRADGESIGSSPAIPCRELFEVSCQYRTLRLKQQRPIPS